MKVLVPVSKYRPVPEEVLESIRVQGIEPEIVDCTFDPEIPKRKRIAMAKTRCKEIGLASKDDYVVINDSDLLHLKTDNFTLMQMFLEKHKDFGAVSLSRATYGASGLVYNEDTYKHVCSGVIMFTRKGLTDVSFSLYENKPTCFSIGKTLLIADQKYGYVDAICRILTEREKK